MGRKSIKREPSPNYLGLSFEMPVTSPTMSELYGPPSTSSYSSCSLLTPVTLAPMQLQNSPYEMMNCFAPFQMQLPQKFHYTAAPTDLFPSPPIDDRSIPPTQFASPCSSKDLEPDPIPEWTQPTPSKLREIIAASPSVHEEVEESEELQPPVEGKKKKRSRTAQACERCRIRKARCHGGQPCDRCTKRGFVCEFASPTKARGPGKVPPKASPVIASPVKGKRRMTNNGDKRKRSRVEVEPEVVESAVTFTPETTGLGLELGPASEMAATGLGLGLECDPNEPMFNFFDPMAGLAFPTDSILTTPVMPQFNTFQPGYFYDPTYPFTPISPYFCDTTFSNNGQQWFGAAY